MSLFLLPTTPPNLYNKTKKLITKQPKTTKNETINSLMGNAIYKHKHKVYYVFLSLDEKLADACV